MLSRNIHWDVHFFEGSKYVNIAACFLAVNNEMDFEWIRIPPS